MDLFSCTRLEGGGPRIGDYGRKDRIEHSRRHRSRRSTAERTLVTTTTSSSTTSSSTSTTMEVDTSAFETNGTRGPSPKFLQRRHERMRTRRNGTAEEDEDVTPKAATTNHFKSKQQRENVDKEDTEEERSKRVNFGEEQDESETSPAEEAPKKTTTLATASPIAIRSFHQLRAKRKARVPGGAAAKLIGKAQMEEEEREAVEDDKDDETSEIAPPTDELIKIREETKAAFEQGTKQNRGYLFYHHGPSGDSQQPQDSKNGTSAERPHVNNRVLNRKEVLHETPTAAVLSLLNGSDAPKLPDNSSNHSNHSKRGHHHDGIPAVSSSRSREAPPLAPAPLKDFTQPPAMEVTPRNVFQAPPRKDDLSSVLSGCSSIGGRPTGAPEEELETTIQGKNPLEQPLLSKQAEQRVAQMKEKMKDPNPTLSGLIANIATPEDHKPGDTFTRGYIVRRKNACGALQVLTAKKAHRVKICWTLGVLPAISSVLKDSGTRDLVVEIPDVPTRKEFIEARKRAVSSLMNLSVPPENRLAVFHTPHMVANIIRVINLDRYEARKGCCAVMAQLAKSKENRLLMVQIPGLIDALTNVIEPKVIIVTPRALDIEDDESTRTPDLPLHSDNNSSASSSTEEPLSSGSFISTEDPKEQEGDGKYAVDVDSVPTQDPAKAARNYDEDPNEHLHGARVNIFALLSHLVKEKDNAYILARHKFLMDTLVEISKLHDSPAHEYAVKLLAHLSRHRGNSRHLVFKLRKVVPALVKASFSQNDETRRHACFALQNLSQDKPCRQELGIADELLTALCVRIRQASDPEERLSAIHALKNLTDEPANLIPMTNTPECFATLMQIAHAGDDSVTEMMQYLGCDALATLSHWFRSIATSGQRIDLNKKGIQPTRELFVPSLKIVPYQQWQ